MDEIWPYVMGLSALGLIYLDYRRDRDVLGYLQEHERRITRVETKLEDFDDEPDAKDADGKENGDAR